MGGKSSSQITGYKYYMSMHMGLCRGPIDTVCHIFVGNKNTWAGLASSGAGFQINLPDLFGGDTGEGGIVGTVDPYFGEATQVLRADAHTQMGANLPEFRGLATLFYQGQVSSNNPYLKSWQIRVRRNLKGWLNDTVWYPEKAIIQIEALRVQFFYAPNVSDYLVFHGTNTLTVTYVAAGTGNGDTTLGVGENLGQAAQDLMGWVNAHSVQLGMQATINGDAFISYSQTTLLVTGTDGTPTGKQFTIDNSHVRQGAPIVNGGDIRTGGIFAQNPAHMLYEVNTNTAWARGLPISMIDDESFRSAANRLYNEGFGLCMKWSQSDSLSSFVQTVLDHISGAMFIDRTTGLVTLKLLRKDYDPDTLPQFAVGAGIIEVVDDDSAAQPQAVNQVVVNYHDPVLDVDLQVRAQNLASYKANQSTISQTNDYPGIPTPYLASQVALRDLTQSAVGLKRFQFKMDQSARFFAPGGLFRFSDPTRNITNLVMRIGKINFGSPADPTITVDALQDVFSLPATIFNATPASEWVPPNNTPAVATATAFFEAGYRDLYRYIPQADLATFPTTSGAVAMLAVNPGLVSALYGLNSGVHGDTLEIENRSGWCSGGAIQSVLSATDTSVTIPALSDPRFIPSETPYAMLLDGEWVRVDAFDGTSVFTIARGCMDTVPTTHAAGTDAYIADFLESTDGAEYVMGEQVDGQCLAITSIGVLDPSLAPVFTVGIVARWFKPYPPGDLKVNGGPYTPAPVVMNADVVLTWAERNRLTQQDALIDFTMATVAPEAGTTYNIRIYSNTTLLRSTTAIVGTTWTYTQAMQGEDAASGVVQFVLESERDGVVSFTNYTFNVGIGSAGWGDSWGNGWGSFT
jgi:hypothetical protein